MVSYLHEVHHDSLLAAERSVLTSLMSSLMACEVRSNSFSWECRESRKYGESCRQSVNSSGRRPIVVSEEDTCASCGGIMSIYLKNVDEGV